MERELFDHFAYNFVIALSSQIMGPTFLALKRRFILADESEFEIGFSLNWKQKHFPSEPLVQYLFLYH